MTDSRNQTLRIAYGTSARLIGRTLGALVTLVALREATRYFDPLQWGEITAALSWFGIFSYLGSPGVATLAMREVARPDADAGSVFGRAITATVLVSLGSILAAAAIGLLVYHGRSTVLAMVLILVLGIPFTGLFLISGSILAGRGRSDFRRGSRRDLEHLVADGNLHRRRRPPSRARLRRRLSRVPRRSRRRSGSNGDALPPASVPTPSDWCRPDASSVIASGPNRHFRYRLRTRRQRHALLHQR